MKTMTATQARASLFGLLDQTEEEHEPVRIQGRRHSAVLIGESDWRAIEETVYLLGVPGMRESVVEGMKLPRSRLAKTPGW